MTLLFVDGFDVGDFALKWLYLNDDAFNPVTISATTPFGEGRSLHIPAISSAISFPRLKRGITASATGIYGWNFRWSGAPTLGPNLLTLYSDGGAVAHLQLQLGTDGTLRLYRADGTLLAWGPASSMLPGIFYFIEIKATIADSGGTCVVRVDEKQIINFTGDTRNGGTSTNIDAIGLDYTSPGLGAFDIPEMFFDDLYACDGLDDGLGPANNDFLGISRVQTLLPDGPGSTTDLTPTPSGPNWDNVNDVPYSTSDYNSSRITGKRDTYGLSDLDAQTASVLGIQTVLLGEADDATAHVKAALRSGGSLYYDPTVALDGTPSDVSIAVRETNPATSATWTVTAVNALEAGMEVA